MGGRAKLLKLLASEDVNGDQVDLGVAVLASLGGRHVDDLAGTALDDNEAVLPKRRALHREGQRRTGVSRVEGVFMLMGHCQLARREGETEGVYVSVLCGHGAKGECIVAVVRGCGAGCPPPPATTRAKERVRRVACLPERRRPS